MGKKLPLYEFSGSFREVGRQYGEECRDKILESLSWWEDIVEYSVTVKKTRQELKDDVLATEGMIHLYTPEIYDELVGIAEGANLPLSDIIFMNAGLDHVAADGRGFAACSSYAVTDTATKDGKTYVGQNLDYFLNLDTCVIKQKLDNGLTVLAATIGYGCLPNVGINSFGLAHFYNVLDNGTTRIGVPILVYSADILLKRDLRQVLMEWPTKPMTRSFNHMLGHADGSMIDMEVTPDNLGLVQPENDILVHTNNFVEPWLKREDVSYGVCADTFFRYYRIKKLMNAEYGNIDMEVLKKILSDQKAGGGYFTINCQPDPYLPPLEQEETLMSFISIPEEGKLYVSTPPHPDYYEYTL